MAELAFRGTNLRRADKSVWFWIVHGWIDEQVEVEGEDQRVAERHGLDQNPRWKVRRPVELRGRLKAGTLAGKLALEQEILALFDVTVRGSLVVADGYRGVTTSATLSSVLPLSVSGADPFIGTHRIYTVTMESVAVPPEWVIA